MRKEIKAPRRALCRVSPTRTIVQERESEPSDSPGRNRRMLALLLNHLQLAFCWPGADGLTIQDALGCYRQAAASGRVPGLEELLREYPEWSLDLRAVFKDVSARASKLE